jgi:hypothetical protein
MRVSLSVSAREGECARCHTIGLVIPFSLIVDDQAGEAEALCAECLFDDDGLSVDLPMVPLAPGPVGRRKALKKNRKLSQRQEVQIADSLKGRTQPGSGNQAGAKGDVRVRGELRVEAKLTKANSFSLKLEELNKIAGECSNGEKPVLVIDFLAPGTDRLRDRFAVLNYHDFERWLHAANEHRRSQ